MKSTSEWLCGETRPRVLCVGGIDPTGASGLVADLRALHSLGVYGSVAVTATTAQTSVAVSEVLPVSASLVEAQMEAALKEPGVDVMKTGMLVSEDTVGAVERVLLGAQGVRLVLDPVLLSTSGRRLLSTDGMNELRQKLIPRAALVTPNLPELAALTGRGESLSGLDIEAAGEELLLLGAGAVFIKGGHSGDEERVVDLLMTADGDRHIIERSRRKGSFRGTGCTLASAIAGYLAEGRTLSGAVSRARDYLEAAMDAPPLTGLGAFLLPGVVSPSSPM